MYSIKIVPTMHHRIATNHLLKFTQSERDQNAVCMRRTAFYVNVCHVGWSYDAWTDWSRHVAAWLWTVPFPFLVHAFISSCHEIIVAALTLQWLATGKFFFCRWCCFGGQFILDQTQVNPKTNPGWTLVANVTWTVPAPKCCQYHGNWKVRTQTWCKYRWNGTF